MKLFFGLGALLVIGLFLIADYKWKRWIAARQKERDHPFNPKS
jgi:hypothetical protein